MIRITNNTVINGTTLLELSAPHTADVLIEGNKGFNMSAELINAQIYVDHNKLNAFLAEITPLLGTLSAEESVSLTSILQELASSETEDKTSALTRLAAFGKEVGTAVVAGVITAFLGPQPS
ncbi:hypothetical protein E2H86_19470 [Pseudomonas putida]|nr:hypothetical protein E2H86_19470 [Pseudomonas putida]